MNKKVNTFIKNLSYALTSNLVSLMISSLIVIIIPKLIGVEEYGYWQLFLFYSSYVGLLHFGLNDGIYLRYGGMEYKDLNKNLFHSQFKLLVISQVLFAVVISCIAFLMFTNENRVFIIQMTAVCMLIVNVRYMFLFILQGTNRIKEYAQIIMWDRLLYLSLIIISLLVGIRDYKLMIVAELLGKLFSLVISLTVCKDIIASKNTAFYVGIREAAENISVGIKLMFSNIASKFVIGIVKFGIERSWNVATFGKVSLTLSISTLIMLFMNALGIIIYPILRRTNAEKLPQIYTIIRDSLMLVLLGSLMLYYPLKSIFSSWLPEYSGGLIYMALLFPVVIFEGKMSFLIESYLKSLRKEKLILNINVYSLLLSVVITLITTVIIKNLDLTVLSIVVILAFRCILAETILTKLIGIKVHKDIILEIIMTLVFIFSAWFIDSWISLLIYIISYVIYIVLKFKNIILSFKELKYLVKP